MSQIKKQRAQPTRKSRPTKGASARFQICSLLMAKGDLSREALKADVSAEARAFDSAIFNAKKDGQLVYLAKQDVYRITEVGKEWTSGGANLENHKAASETARATPTKRFGGSAKQRLKPEIEANLTEVKLGRIFAGPESRSSIEVVQERSFRCAVISDGGFFLAKGDKQIDLTPTEHREMLRYLDRMAIADGDATAP